MRIMDPVFESQLGPGTLYPPLPSRALHNPANLGPKPLFFRGGEEKTEVPEMK